MSTHNIIAVARSYIGVPFLHRGRTREGLDCAGLIIAVADDCGIATPKQLFYERMPSVTFVEQVLLEYAKPIKHITQGCIVRIRIARQPQHLAFVAEHKHTGFSLIHAAINVGRVCEHRLDERWFRRVVDYWTIV